MTVIDIRTRQRNTSVPVRHVPLPETPASLVTDGEDEERRYRRMAAANLLDQIRVLGLVHTRNMLLAQLHYIDAKIEFGRKP